MLTSIRSGLARLTLKAATAVTKLLMLPLVPAWVKDAWTDIAFRTLCEQGYRLNAAVWGCVRVYARAFPEPPLRVWRRVTGGEPEAINHPALDRLLRKPNASMSEETFWSFVATYLALGGNAYLWIQRSAAGLPAALWPLHDGQMRPVPGRLAWISHYLYDCGDGIELTIPAADVIQLIWAPDPLQPTRGLAPLVAAARAVDTDTEAMRYVFALLKNDAVPRTVVITEGIVNPVDRTELRERFAEQYGGDNRGGVAIIGGGEGVKIERLGALLEDLQAESIHNVPETRIATAFEVPAILVGLNVGLQRAINANAEELIAFHTRQVMVPLWRRLAAELSQRLIEEFGAGDDVFLDFDLSKVQALRLEDLKLRENATTAWVSGLMQQNEARHVHGLPSVEGGDRFYQAPALPAPGAGGDVIDATARLVEGDTPALPAPTSGNVEGDEALTEQQVLNGAQIKSAVEIVQAVADRELPRSTGVAMIARFFNLAAADAEAIMGEVGTSFFAEKPAAPVPPAKGRSAGDAGEDEEPDDEEEDDGGEEEGDAPKPPRARKGGPVITDLDHEDLRSLYESDIAGELERLKLGAVKRAEELRRTLGESEA